MYTLGEELPIKEKTRLKIFAALKGQSLSFGELADKTRISRRILVKRLREMEENKEVIVSFERSNRGPAKTVYRLMAEVEAKYGPLINAFQNGQMVAEVGLKHFMLITEGLNVENLLFIFTAYNNLFLQIILESSLLLKKRSDIKADAVGLLTGNLYLPIIIKLNTFLIEELAKNPEQTKKAFGHRFEFYEKIFPEITKGFKKAIKVASKELDPPEPTHTE